MRGIDHIEHNENVNNLAQQAMFYTFECAACSFGIVVFRRTRAWSEKYACSNKLGEKDEKSKAVADEREQE